MLRKTALFLFILAFLAVPFAWAQETVTISGTVAPKIADYEFAFEATDTAITFSQNTLLTYEITYGAKTSAGFATPLTITADWSEGKTNDGTLLVSFASAGNAYATTEPIIDLTHRTITWNIPAIPAGTNNQKVSFQLRTTANYTDSNPANFIIKAKIHNNYIAFSDQTINQTYLFDPTLVSPSITPAPTTIMQQTFPTITPINTTTPTPFTTTAPLALEFVDVGFSQITDSSLSIVATTSQASRIMLSYGTNRTNLGNTISTSSFNASNTLTLQNLQPLTTYYFQMTATDTMSNRKTSDIFTVRTAQPSEIPTFEDNIVVVTSNGTLLTSESPSKSDPQKNIALVTTQTPYEITYHLRHPISIKTIEAVMRSKNVLGLNTFSKVLGSQTITVPMHEKSPNVYVATLRSDIAGTFDVFVRIQDTKGNLIEEKVAQTKIMPLLSVMDNTTHQPIADARVLIKYFNTHTRTYEIVAPTLLDSSKNPSYTSLKGTINVLLPQGKYQATVNAFGYDPKIINFTIGPNPGEDFPQIYLAKNPADLANYLAYYTGALTDLVTKTFGAIAGLAFSVRFFNLLAAFIVFLSILTTFLFFHLKTHVSPLHIIPYFIHHLKELFHKHTLNSFCATITDEAGRKISDARVATIDDRTGDVITSFSSNKNGICYILNPHVQNQLKLLITKEGFAPKTVAVDADISLTRSGFTIIMRKGKAHTHTPLREVWHVVEHLAGLFFELSLLGSILLEIVFFSLFGFGKTLPFFILSLFNLLVWAFYQKEKQDRKVFKKL